MGEYFDWVNVDKREFICPNDFDYGNKFHKTMHKDSVPLHALHVLLAENWKGDHVIWLGDECAIPEDSSNIVFKKLYDQSVEYGERGNAIDMYFETYKNVLSLFKEAEKEVRQEIGFYLEDLKSGNRSDVHNEYGVDPEHPFDGLFQKSARRFKYTVNHTKKVYYALDETDILFQDNTKNDFSDPLPLLMGYGRVADPGEWLGDIIGVSDIRPEGYSLLPKPFMYGREMMPPKNFMPRRE